MSTARSSAAVSLAVWKALFLREMLGRLAAGRGAWLWILVEPTAQVLLLMGLFGFIYQRIISGVDGSMFIMTGVLAFALVQGTATRSMEAVRANLALFAYRQVRPVDTVLVRAALEGFVMATAGLVLMGAASFFGLHGLPDDPLGAMVVVFLIWCLGLGLALSLSVLSDLVPEVGKLAPLAFRPLYLASGVMFPAMAIPQPYREWLMANPIMHGMEALRGAFFSQYHAVPETSLAYLGGFGALTVFFGLALHLRYARRLVSR